jgi:tRNA-Thr(GGU) m(6)t(6)A37 methyltransferase TsaA
MKKIPVDLKIVGIVHSPYKTLDEVPFQGNEELFEIEILKQYEEGLQDIEGFSHLHVLYWLSESKGYSLLVKTPWDEKSHGLFTTRTPRRPNPIGLAVVKLVKRKENKLIVKGLDAIEGTPIIDIKPYIKKIDMKKDASLGWSKHTHLGKDDL